jgi:hypothetical protein
MKDILRFPSLSRQVSIRLSVEAPSGKRRRVNVEVERCPCDDDNTVMVKASTEYRRRHGFASRIVAIYVTSS